LSIKTENLIPDQLSRVEEVNPAPGEARPQKKEFVEPEVSFPVDVLEATTFFQLTDSGSTT
jgi:hypothetical protein